MKNYYAGLENELKQRYSGLENELKRSLARKKDEFDRKNKGLRDNALRDEREKEIRHRREIAARKAMNRERKRLKEKFAVRLIFLQKKVDRIKANENNELEKERKNFEEKFNEHVKKNDAEFSVKVKGMRKNLYNELQLKLAEIKKEKDERLKSILLEKEKTLRANLEKEYSEKLKEEIKRKSDELARRRLEIEKHILEETKRLLN